MVAGGELLGQGFFRVHRVEIRIAGLTEEEGVVAVHELIGDAHEFAEDVLRAVFDPDVVAVGLGHFFDSVEAFEQGHDHDDLLWLGFFFLKIAADEDVEELVGAADLHIGTDFN